MNNLQSKVLSVVAWFFGVIFIMGALGAFLEGSLVAGLLMLVAGILFLPPIKRLILDKQPNLSKGKITAAGTILVVISFFFLPLDTEVTDEDQDLTNESAAKTEQDAVSPTATQEVEPTVVNTTPEPVAPPVEVDYSHVSYEITESGYPRTYSKWGKKWIDDINRMMPLAVKRVASNPKCDSPEVADLSDNRSTPKKEAVFYVDCSNGERFYMSQNELSNTTQIQAESDVLSGEPSQYIQPCRDMIKAQLSYPSTFDESFGSVNAFKGTSGNIVVGIDFTAKNAIGAELPQSARCVFGTNGENEAVITNR